MSRPNCCDCRKSLTRPPEVEAPPLIVDKLDNHRPDTGMPAGVFLLGVAVLAAVAVKLWG